MLNLNILMHFQRRPFIGFLIFLVSHVHHPTQSLLSHYSSFIFLILDIYLVFSLQINKYQIIVLLPKLVQKSPDMVALAVSIYTDLCIKVCIDSKEFLSLPHFLKKKTTVIMLYFPLLHCASLSF